MKACVKLKTLEDITEIRIVPHCMHYIEESQLKRKGKSKKRYDYILSNDGEYK